MKIFGLILHLNFQGLIYPKNDTSQNILTKIFPHNPSSFKSACKAKPKVPTPVSRSSVPCWGVTCSFSTVTRDSMSNPCRAFLWGSVGVAPGDVSTNLIDCRKLSFQLSVWIFKPFKPHCFKIFQRSGSMIWVSLEAPFDRLIWAILLREVSFCADCEKM